MYVDFTDDKLYVTILPVPSQKKEHLIRPYENVFHYLGGVSNAIINYNLKSDVTKPGEIEPAINNNFAAFAEYYNCIVFPAKVPNLKIRLWVKMM